MTWIGHVLSYRQEQIAHEDAVRCAFTSMHHRTVAIAGSMIDDGLVACVANVCVLQTDGLHLVRANMPDVVRELPNRLAREPVSRDEEQEVIDAY